MRQMLVILLSWACLFPASAKVCDESWRASPFPVHDADCNVKMQAAANGSTNNQIALALGISERTVRAHLTNIYNKFGVSSRGAAIGYAAQHGLLES